MYLGIKEAKSKWCPFARVSTYELNNPNIETAVNRCKGMDELYPPYDCRCFGDDCAMWVWAKEVNVDKSLKGFCGLIKVTHTPLL